MEPANELLNKLTFCRTSSRAAQKASCRGLFLELLLLILTPVFNPSPKEDRSEHLANEARKLLQQPISQKQSIQEILQTLGRSYAHLCRIFRKIYSATPIEYLNAVRIENAKSLLRNPRRNVSEVARAVGFNDPQYFSRVFRRYTGVSPRDFYW
ncbi:MAG: helix-turn-helix transcriptional regulator [Verrucomicrobia bacterium]|nr:helix-turn-helix transcriptional regulator [Verrucomicrobiota bacterium]MBU1734297.1 helix-turn-helix transcriptional regulator [Verrucomicrobiota bacterium]MBU1857018.1 helix-turn-helix transcriptional regulator [Verrucomicrobiota bacterium]